MREDLLAAERWAYRRGFFRVAGVDEAGRGALAGPLVAAAVILPADSDLRGLEGLADSKALSPAQRRILFPNIIEVAEAWSFSCVPPWEIDDRGLQEANLKALREAVQSLSPAPELVLVDYYRVERLGLPQWNLVHGDRYSASVAAASVLAKVIRDSLMLTWWTRCPGYGFEAHKGYGTGGHLRSLAEKGPAPCHRRSFRRVLQLSMEVE
ncbi:MAG: ribonuclease HII [Actinomycetota bacterium]